MQLVGRIENIVLQGARREADKILEEARARASSIIEEARKKVPSILEYYDKRARRWIELERQRQLGLAQLKVNEAYLKAEHEVLARVFDGLEEEVRQKLKSPDEYRSYMKTILQEIFQESQFEEPIVKVNPSDESIVKDILREMGIDARVEGDDSVELGAVVEDEERGFLIYNTLQTRMDRVRRIVSEEIRKFWEG